MECQLASECNAPQQNKPFDPNYHFWFNSWDELVYHHLISNKHSLLGNHGMIL